MTTKKISLTVAHIFLTFIALATLFPLIYTFTSSFKDPIEVLISGNILPKKFSLENFILVWNSPELNISRQLLNSIVYSVSSVLISIVIATMAGYVFSTGEFKLKKLIYVCFSFLIFIKLGGIDIYPTFDVFNLLHIPINLYGLMFLHLFNIPIVHIYLSKGFVDSLPTGMLEAAEIDGCGYFMSYLKIVLPLMKPMIATIAIMSFQSSWNEYIMPNIFTLANPEQRTLVVGLMALKSSGGSAASWHLMLAGTVLSVIPIIAAYIVCNKYFVRGLIAGAEKG